MRVQVRLETFRDVVNEVPEEKLPVVFAGELEEAVVYCEEQGFDFKPSKKARYGGFYYRREPETTALVLT